MDEFGQEQIQIAFVGDKNVQLKNLGISKRGLQEGTASDWIRDGIFKLLGKKKS